MNKRKYDFIGMLTTSGGNRLRFRNIIIISYSIEYEMLNDRQSVYIFIMHHLIQNGKFYLIILSHIRIDQRNAA